MATVQVNILQFETDFQTCDTSKYVESNCNTITFINYGTSPVSIESVTLQQNQQFEIGGNTAEVTTQRFFVNFGTSTSGNNCVVVRKRYLNV